LSGPLGGDGEQDDPAETQRPPLELDVTAFAAGAEAPSPARSSFVPEALVARRCLAMSRSL
jgi:hypothetical protein